MKFLKSKVVASLLGISITFGAANVYAVSELNTNVLGMISGGVQTLGSYLSGKAKGEVTSISNAKIGDISEYVKNKAVEVNSEMEEAKSAEVKRAQAEIDAHYNKLVEETDAAFETGVNEEKGKLKAEVNKGIEKAKQDLESELEKQLKEAFKIKNNNGNGNGNGN